MSRAYHDVLFGYRQTVGWELAGLVLLFPFSASKSTTRMICFSDRSSVLAVLTLFVIGVEFKPSSSSLKNAFHALQLLVIADAAFRKLYYRYTLNSLTR